MNEHLKKYKDCHKGETAIFYGNGPTLNDYAGGIDGVTFGTNAIIDKQGVELDYYFVGDPGSKNGYLDKLDKYLAFKPKIKKFHRGESNKITCFIPRKEGNQGEGDEWYKIKEKRKFGFSADCSNFVGAGVSISFEVMQFILYMGFEKVVLIGHDANYKDGSFNSKDTRLQHGSAMLVQSWRDMHEFLRDKPIVVYVINPVSLKIFPEWSEK